METNHPTKKLGEVVDILDNLRKPVTRRERLLGPYPYYGATGVQDYVANFIFDEDLVLVGEDGARWNAGDNSAYKISGKSWVNNHAHVLRPHRDILLDDWLVYFLNISDLSGYITGTTVKKLNQAKLRLIEIPIPSLAEQRKIVEKIEKLFAKIDEASRLRAESLTASAALLPSALHQIFSSASSPQASHQKHSNILENVRISQTKQKAWEEKKIGEIAEINPSKREIAEINASTEISFVSMSAVSEKTQIIERQETRKIDEVKKGYTYFREDDVLFAKITPCMENGKVTIAKNLKNGIGFGSTEFHVLRAKENVLSKWLFYFLWNPEFRKEAQNNMTGTAGQRRVPMEFLTKVKIPLPPVAEQKKIVEYLDSLSAKARALQSLQQETKNDFSALRQSVLHQSFSTK
ncbi:MAG: restriction endonuclease subunit S [bacterium]|nr:restriction endonuclease subunit S [bacterium]